MPPSDAHPPRGHDGLVARAIDGSAPNPARDHCARLLDQTGQPFVFLGLDGRILYVNQAFGRLLGFESHELIGRLIAEITPESWEPTTEEAIRRLHQTGLAQRYEKAYRHRDGSTIPVALVTDFERDDQGLPRAFYAFVTDIREQKRAEEALRASEERFRRLYDEAPFGYHVIDTQGRILNVNRTECDLLGYEPAEMIGRSIFDFVVEGQRPSARWALDERVQGQWPVQEIERSFRTKDGRERVFAIENRLLRNDEGRIAGVQGTVQDITDRKKTEAALIASERRLRALFEGIEDAVFVHDLDGRVLDTNPAACRRLGYTREEFLKLNSRDIDDPEFAAGFTDRLEAQLRLGRLSCEGRHRTKDGRVIPVDISTSLIQFENQTAILVVVRDITERKALEDTRRQFAEAQMRYAREMETKARELARSESRYRQLTASLLDAVIVTDPSGRVTLFNRAAERVFEYEAAEVLGREIALMIPNGEANHDHRLEAVASIQQALREADPRVVGRTIETTGRRRSGENFPMEISVAAVEARHDAQDGLEFIASIRDQTERQRMRAMLMQSEKLASIGLLSAGVAHEINNPLAYIANNLAVLERDLSGILGLVDAYSIADEALATAAPEAAARVQAISEDLDWAYVRENLPRMLGRTREGVQRVANIVQNLRGLARTSPPTMESVALSDLIDAALDIVRSQIKRSHVELTVEKAPLPKLACVPSQISQVILNLVVNALQAIESSRPAEGGRLRVTLRGRPDYQVIEIADNGSGIKSSDMHRLFDPFFTTKPVGEGTGLGLSITHGIVTGHGGQIDIECPPGQGTVFRVSLPAKGN